MSFLIPSFHGYGVVPESNMISTFSTTDTNELNQKIADCLYPALDRIRRENLSHRACKKLKEEKMQQVRNILISFMGEPPTQFNWTFENEDQKRKKFLNELKKRKVDSIELNPHKIAELQEAIAAS